MAGFSKGLGNWLGSSEVYDGKGQFLGYASDKRQVQKIAENQIRIDLSFTGVLSLEGNYTIETRDGYRLYQGPANVGFAEALGEALVEANNYWAQWGLSQRFFLYVTPDKTMQLSLALLSRGEDLQYVILGENYQQEGKPANSPKTENGKNLLHRAGRWQGEMTVLDGAGQPIAVQSLCQTLTDSLEIAVEGSAFVQPYRLNLQASETQAWTGAGDVVGSYSFTGGRALSGQFHFLKDELRVWWREVATRDGSSKVLFQTFYHGGQRIGIQYGLMHYER